MRTPMSIRGAVAAAAIVAGLGLPTAHAFAAESAQPAAAAERTAAENVVYTMSDTYPGLSSQLASAVSQGANEFRLKTDITDKGTITIPTSFSLLRGWDGGFFTAEGPKTRQLGYWNALSVVFPAGSNITVDHIDFYRTSRAEANEGATVTVDEGATVTFSNVNFSNTPIVNGTAIFENCTFATGKIENNGSATYTGTTKEPENIGTPKADVYAPLAISVQRESFETVVRGAEVSQSVDVGIEGTAADDALLSAHVDTASGLTATIEGGKLTLTGTAERAGSYEVTLTASATKPDGEKDVATKSFRIAVVEPIKASLSGEIQAFVSTTGKTGSPTGAATSAEGSAQPFPAEASASSGSASRPAASPQPFAARASASSGGGLTNTPTNKLELTVAEGEGAPVSILEFQRANPNAKVSFSVTPAGSGMSASLVYNTVYVNGTPDAPGTYYVSATVTDGARSATTNQIPFRIYSGTESLKTRFSQLDPSVFDWDMEPYEIPNTENATVPTQLKNIYGSHESGVYGQIGSGEKDYDSETLTIPAGADVTIHNMKINSSVRVIVEKGAKLTLVDSVVFGPVDVYGTISGTDATTTNTVTLHDGSAIENLDLNSHAHYLTDGSLDAPTPTSPVVVEGTVEVRGANTVAGDEGASSLAGQNAIEMKPGSALKLTEGSKLTAKGGEVSAVYPSKGGHGIVMGEGSKITGPGAVEAEGGESYQRDAGDGISGSGIVDVDELTAKGGDSAPEGYPTVTGRRGTGGDAVAKTVLVRANKLTATGGAGEHPGSSEITPYGGEAEDPSDPDNGNGSGSDSGSNGDTGNAGSGNGNPGSGQGNQGSGSESQQQGQGDPQGNGGASTSPSTKGTGKTARKTVGKRGALPRTGDTSLVAGAVAAVAGVIATVAGALHLRKRR